MRLVFLNRCYWPDSEATGQLLTDLAEAAAAAGHDVEVLCGFPNSPPGDQPLPTAGVTERHGVTIHRLRHTRFPKRMPAGRLVNLLTFTAAADRYLRRRRLATDVLISETDPFLLPWAAARHQERIGCRYVAYLQDIYPDVAEAIGKVGPGPVTATVRRTLRRSYQRADRLIVLGQCMKRRITSPPWNVESVKVSIIPNWTHCQSIVPVDRAKSQLRRQQKLGNRFVVMHSGNMGLTQGLDQLITATTLPAWPDDAVLLLVGDGADRSRLAGMMASQAGDRVRLLPYQPRDRLGDCLGAADLHVVSMHPAITGCLCPSKLYGILAAGRPVLAIAPPGTDLAETIDRHELGWSVPPRSPPAIAAAVADAASQPTRRRAIGSRARQLALTHFDQPFVIGQLIEAITTAGLTPTHPRA